MASVSRLLVVLVLLVLAGCAAEPGRPVPPTSSPPPVTTEPSETGHTLAELERHPCTLLTAEESSSAGYTGDGQEQPNDYGELVCNWEKDGMSIGFTAFASSDVTRSPAVAQATGRVTQSQVTGHPAVQIEYFNACFLYVALGPDQSFRLTVIGTAQETLCPSATRFAALAVEHMDVEP